MAGRLENVVFFQGYANTELANAIFRDLKEYVGRMPDVGQIDYGRWGDGEVQDMFVDPKSLKGKTVVFFECLKEESVLFRLLQLCWAAKHQYGAKKIILALSFMHFRRQDRYEYTHEICRSKWLPHNMKANGVDCVNLVTPHSERIEENFKEAGVEFSSVEPFELFASRLKPLFPKPSEGKIIKVYAPDEGSIPRAIGLAKALEVGVLFSLKSRGFNNDTKPLKADQKKIDQLKRKFSSCSDLEYATADIVKGAIIVMAEDEIDSGGTANAQANMLKEYGVEKIYAVFTHAVCTNPWKRKFFGKVSPFSQVIMCDTIPRGAEKRTGGKIHDVSVSNLMASELLRILKDS